MNSNILSCVDNEFVQLTKTKTSANGEEMLVVDLDAVKAVLGNPDYSDHYVAIYTIAGPTRSGKSFLFSLLWQFLHKVIGQGNGFEQWSSNEERVQKIFSWRNSAKSCTRGINILKKPIIGSKNGKKTALFLMDTQGSFDHDATERNQNFLGTFSFLLSSYVFFNVDKSIKTTHLQLIYKFAKNLRGGDGLFTMQKESLMFVVRDWIHVGCDDGSDDNGGHQDFAYGTDGGKRYFEALIQEDSPNRAQEHQTMQEFLKYAFGKNIPCCLLPHPGNKVGQKNCSVAELSEDFRRESFIFFRTIKNKNKFKIKKIQEPFCKCGELCEAIEDYVSQLGAHLDVTDRDSFLTKDFRVKMSRHVKNCVKDFVEKLLQNQNEWKSKDTKTMAAYLKELKSPARTKLRKVAGEFYPPRVIDEWEEELDRVLSQVIRNLKTCVQVEKAYKEAILAYSTWQKSSAKAHLEKAQNFQNQAKKKRDSLLQEMKDSIRLKVEQTEQLENVIEQSEGWFFADTNKLTAKVDADIQDYLNKLKIVRTSLRLFVALGALIVRTRIFPTNQIRAAADVAANALTGVDETDSADNAIPNFVATLATKVGEEATKAVYVSKVKGKAEPEILDSSLKLQEYKHGKMTVKLLFGKVIEFELEVRKNLEN